MSLPIDVVQFYSVFPMNGNEVIPQAQEYQPTESQLERSSAIRRFNLLFVYIPVGFLAIIGLLLTATLLYLALSPPTEQTIRTLSGLADAVTILGTIPLLVLCAVAPTLFFVAVTQAKKNDTSPIRQLQTLMWRLEGGIRSLHQPVKRFAQKLANPFISIHGLFDFLQTWIREIRDSFR